MCVCVCVFVCLNACTCAYVCATEGSGAAVCSTGWQGGCQNGPVSCVSSKIGPNTAEMHDTLWLFTALSQCVCAGCCQVYGTRRTLCVVLYLLRDCNKGKKKKRCIHYKRTYSLTRGGRKIYILEGKTQTG